MTNLDLLQPFDPQARAKATPIYEISADPALSDAPAGLKSLAARNGFAGEAGALLAGDDGVLLGVGDGADPMIAAAAADRLPAGAYCFHQTKDAPAETLRAYAWLAGGYRFDRYKAAAAPQAVLVAGAGADVTLAKSWAASDALVRDLVNTPAADMSPADIANAALELAAEFGVTARVIVGDALLKENFPMVHAVGRAAATPPRLIDFCWGDPGAPKVTLVGKGVAFDSGGLNMKNGTGMALMKKDMGGAAHTLGLARMIMAARLNVRLRVIIPAVENAVSGDAFRPSDILQSRAGLTVEIGNTDAEGRLILADGLALAGEDNPDLVITLATLTGAARVALGPEVIPYYSDDDALAAALDAASKACADPVWRMPLWRNYEAMMSSQIADINHIAGNAFAGSVIAALFLRKFVTATSWVHFDLYAWRPKAAPGRPVGAETQAIRAVFETLRSRFG